MLARGAKELSPAWHADLGHPLHQRVGQPVPLQKPTTNALPLALADARISQDLRRKRLPTPRLFVRFVSIWINHLTHSQPLTLCW